MKEINLQLTLDEANLILEALGNLPFVKVYALIGKIQQQAGQQLGLEIPATKESQADHHPPMLKE